METENYIIKINPNFINRNPADRDNVIDARIISKKYGCFIDITFLTTDVKIIITVNLHIIIVKILWFH